MKDERGRMTLTLRVIAFRDPTFRNLRPVSRSFRPGGAKGRDSEAHAKRGIILPRSSFILDTCGRGRPHVAEYANKEHTMLIVDSQIHIWQNGKMSPHHRQIPTYSARRCAGRDDIGRRRLRGHPSARLARRGRSTCWPSRRCASTRTSSASSGISTCRARIARRSSRTGANGRACSGSGLPSASRTRRRGGPTARSTGSGRRARRRTCASAFSPAGRPSRHSARSPSGIPA